MFSIITITYNRKDLLKITINSVLAQSYSDFEFIIIDDGSTDGTRQMVTEFIDSRVSYYYVNHIGWLSKIRNIGLAKSTRSIICLLDSDDYWHVNYLQELSSIYANKQINSVISNALVFNNTTEKTLFYASELLLGPGYILTYRLKNHSPLIYPSCFSFLKKPNLRFNENLKWGDNDLILRILALGSTYISKSELVFIRKHDKNMSNNKTKDSLFIQAYTEEFITLNYLKDNKFISGYLYRETYSTYLYKQGNNFLEIGLKSDAWLAYLKSFILFPLRLKPFFKLFLIHRYV
ncbi:glycosyltransferase family 2 protein [Spirosoma sp. KCTC 42546]|uniref:glycosyltransferase family 2 protein n=1 Tax=Spirosoma sp. KCTC 42546 TaxID=2520506 RepID=UPI001159AED6|nr:glycosyltransferase family 2 protein [Spirosoma sp. KCTC 42546]QDK81077.1 glycosyltransferase family 2 protein [Spirosoma sp. KCTC 42546]